MAERLIGRRWPGGIGVLALDFRTTAAIEHGAGAWPAAILDVVQVRCCFSLSFRRLSLPFTAILLQAGEWLASQQAGEIMLHGDSSGGTQTVQVLLWMADKEMAGTVKSRTANLHTLLTAPSGANEKSVPRGAPMQHLGS